MCDLFPLTPAISLGERVNSHPPLRDLKPPIRKDGAVK